MSVDPPYSSGKRSLCISYEKTLVQASYPQPASASSLSVLPYSAPVPCLYLTHTVSKTLLVHSCARPYTGVATKAPAVEPVAASGGGTFPGEHTNPASFQPALRIALLPKRRLIVRRRDQRAPGQLLKRRCAKRALGSETGLRRHAVSRVSPFRLPVASQILPSYARFSDHVGS